MGLENLTALSGGAYTETSEISALSNVPKLSRTLAPSSKGNKHLDGCYGCAAQNESASGETHREQDYVVCLERSERLGRGGRNAAPDPGA